MQNTGPAKKLHAESGHAWLHWNDTFRLVSQTKSEHAHTRHDVDFTAFPPTHRASRASFSWFCCLWRVTFKWTLGLASSKDNADSNRFWPMPTLLGPGPLGSPWRFAWILGSSRRLPMRPSFVVVPIFQPNYGQRNPYNAGITQKIYQGLRPKDRPNRPKHHVKHVVDIPLFSPHNKHLYSQMGIRSFLPWKEFPSKPDTTKARMLLF